MATRNLIDTQTKLIKKELSKTRVVISNKIVLFKSNKQVDNYTLALSPQPPISFNLTLTTMDSFFSVATQETSPYGFAFSSDGTKMFVVGSGGIVYQYNLSTPWSVTSAVYNSMFSVATQDTAPSEITFSSDGTKMFVVGITNDAVYQYNLGTAWSVTSAVYNSMFSVVTQETNPYSVTFSSDGTKMFIVGAGGSVHQYILSVAWSVTSAVYDSSFSTATQESTPYGVVFSNDGTKMFIVGSISDRVHQYTLGTAWSVTSAVYVVGFWINSNPALLSQVSSPKSITLSSDGTKMFIVGSFNDRVNQYNLFGVM